MIIIEHAILRTTNILHFHLLCYETLCISELISTTKKEKSLTRSKKKDCYTKMRQTIAV